MTELKVAPNQALARTPVPPAQLMPIRALLSRGTCHPSEQGWASPHRAVSMMAAAPANIPLQAGDWALPRHTPTARAGKLVQAGVPGSSSRTAPSPPQAIEPWKGGCRLDRLAGPALPSQGSIQLPSSARHWGTMGTWFPSCWGTTGLDLPAFPHITSPPLQISLQFTPSFPAWW